MGKYKQTPFGKAYDYQRKAEQLVKQQDHGKAILSYEQASKLFSKTAKFYRELPESEQTDSIKNLAHKSANSAKQTGDKAEELRGIRGDPSLFQRVLSGARISLIIFTSSIIIGLIFLSPALTGNTIANLTAQTSNIIAGVLFIIGIVACYFWFKK